VSDGAPSRHANDAEIERLAIAARSGDPRALNAFLGAIQGQVLRYCRSKVAQGGTLTAHDVAQDVLYAVCDALPRYQPEDGGSVMAFVLGIARFKIVDAFRAGGRDRSVPMEIVPDRPDLDDGPELAAIRATETVRLREALAQLAEHHREVIVLRIGLSYSAEEVARLLGTTAGAVRVTQHRAMAKLRALLNDPVPED
jgi:RNA polymerase sigma-70 factor, ECF subfamily